LAACLVYALQGAEKDSCLNRPARGVNLSLLKPCLHSDSRL
jgi:hypothetical protein